MDSSLPTSFPVTRTIMGKVYTFSRINLPMIHDIATKLSAEVAASNAALAEKYRLDAWQRFRADQEHQRAGIPLTDVYRYLRSDVGVVDGFNRICPSDVRDHIEAALGPVGVADLVLDALSTPPVPPSNAKKGNGGPEAPNPQSQQTGT